MRIPSGITNARDLVAIERFADATGIGPLFNTRPSHRGQHSWCCTECNAHRAEKAKRKAGIKQPWEVSAAQEEHEDDLLRWQYPHEDHFYWWARGYKDQLVYFIQPCNRPNDPVKIGIARDPVKRLATFQTAYPVRLSILCAIPGGRRLEGCLHELFKDSSSHGEWFIGPAVPTIVGLGLRLRNLMHTEYVRHERIPEPPNLHRLTNLAGEVRRSLATTAQMAA